MHYVSSSKRRERKMTAWVRPISDLGSPGILGASALIFASLCSSSQSLGQTWNPGMMSSGGIPVRTENCATLSPLGNGQDDTAQIQAAIDACPLGQVVKLLAGTFTINGGKYVLINKGITLRGAGMGQTILQKTDGSHQYPGQAVGANPSPGVIIGPGRWGNSFAGSINLTADAAEGAHSVTVASTAGLSVGQFVLLDELSGAGWQADPVNPAGQVWASPDYRVVWKKHRPYVQFFDDFQEADFPYMPGTFGETFSRLDRPTCEMKEIASINGNTITFTTPFHISYRVGHTAQISYFQQAHVKNAGLEGVSLTGFDDGALKFYWSAYSWAKDVENSTWSGMGIEFSFAFRAELREFYSHHTSWATTGGGSYAIALNNASADVLIEDGISILANKPIVARAAGAGSVVGYNYMDMEYLNYNAPWIEMGLNGSHFVGPHHMLFEGNYGVNGDSDDTHGNSIYHTFFRNHLRCIRASFKNQNGGGTVDDAASPTHGPKRCAGPMTTSYWFSFIGNVMGAAGQMSGFAYEGTWTTGPAIWMLGWGVKQDQAPVSDPKVAATIVRDGNWDFSTNSQHWHNTPGGYTIPNSMYLTSKPAFFGNNPWPWVDPASGKTYTLPAKARYDGDTGPAPGGAPSPGPTCALASKLGDFNGDGRSDLLFRRTDGMISQYLMNGFEFIAINLLGGVGVDFTLVAVADFNGDRNADMLFRRASDGMLSLYLLNGPQLLGAQLLGAIGTDWDLVGAADFDGDGRADMLFRRKSDGMLSLYLMHGFQMLQAQLLGAIGNDFRVGGIADFNGDGRADILFRRESDGMVSLYLFDGFTNIGAQLLGAVGVDFRLLGVGDFNGDGRADMLFRRPTDGMLSVYLLDGFQLIGAQLLGAVGTNSTLLGIGDLNGDGRADMLLRRSDGLLTAYLMNGFQLVAFQALGTIGLDWKLCYGQPPLIVVAGAQ